MIDDDPSLFSSDIDEGTLLKRIETLVFEYAKERAKLSEEISCLSERVAELELKNIQLEDALKSAKVQLNDVQAELLLDLNFSVSDDDDVG